MSSDKWTSRISLQQKRPGPKKKNKKFTFSPIQLPDWAHNVSNPLLQQEIERYLKLSDGATRILSIAQKPVQCLDAAKTLLVSNAQLMSCLRRVQREKVAEAKQQTTQHPISEVPSVKGDGDGAAAVATDDHACNGDSSIGKARICLSDLRIPLLWRNIPLGTNMASLIESVVPAQNTLSPYLLWTPSNDAMNTAVDGANAAASTGSNGHSVFCLVRLGHGVRDTRLIFDIQPGTTDIEFDERLIFEDVSPDFRCIVEVYSYRGGSTGANRRRSSSIDAFKKLIDQFSTGVTNQNYSNYFELVGRCVLARADLGHGIGVRSLETGRFGTSYSTLNFDDADVLSNSGTAAAGENNPRMDDASNHGFVICAPESSSDLPLFGSMCLRLVAQPYSSQEILKSSLMWIRQLTASPTQAPAQLYECHLSNRQLKAFLVDENGLARHKKHSHGNQHNGTNGDSGSLMRRPQLLLKQSFTESPINLRHRASNRSTKTSNRKASMAQPIPDLCLSITPETQFLDPLPVQRLLPITFVKQNQGFPKPPRHIPERYRGDHTFKKNPIRRSQEMVTKSLIHLIGSSPSSNAQSSPRVWHSTSDLSEIPRIRHVSKVTQSSTNNGGEDSIGQSLLGDDGQVPTALNQSAQSVPQKHQFSGKATPFFHSSLPVLAITASEVMGANATELSPTVELYQTRGLGATQLSDSPRVLNTSLSYPNITNTLGVDELKPSFYASLPSLLTPLERIDQSDKISSHFEHDESNLESSLLAQSLNDIRPVTSIETERVSVEPQEKEEVVVEDQQTPPSPLINGHSNPGPVTVSLHTLRVSNQTGSSLIKTTPAVAERGSAVEVFELAGFNWNLVQQVKTSRPDEGVVDLSNESDFTIDWLNAFRRHVEEQIVWGAEAFATDIPLPQATPAIQDSSARRSMIFVDDTRPPSALTRQSHYTSLPTLAEAV